MFTASGEPPMEGPPVSLAFWAVGELGRRRLFTDPDGCRDDEVRSHKEGSMNEAKSNTRIAGVDVSKPRLDVALHGAEPAATLQVANTAQGHAELVAWLSGHGVGRVGLEATGGYERGVVEALAAAGLEVVIHQPLEVRLFARIKRLRAKNDRIDARLTALATAQVDTVKAAADPRLRELAERLTAYEQAADLATLLKTQMEHIRLPDLLEDARAQWVQLKDRKARLAADLLARLRVWPDLARRVGLVRSPPGGGPLLAPRPGLRAPAPGAPGPGAAGPPPTGPPAPTGARGSPRAADPAPAPCSIPPPGPPADATLRSRP